MTLAKIYWKLLSVFVIFFGPSVLLADNSYRHAPTKPLEQGCQILSRGPGVDVKAHNPGLQSFLGDFLGDLSAKKWKSLRRYLHKKSRRHTGFGERVQVLVENRYQLPNFSIYRVWSLADSEKRKQPYRCPYTDFEDIVSRYGFAEQYFVTIQILGQKELGRIFIVVAPDRAGQLAIVGFHMQQWSFQGKDWQAWMELGQHHQKNGDKKAAYLAYTVSEKMLRGGDFVRYLRGPEISRDRTNIMTDQAFVQALARDGADTDIVYGASALHPEGLGLFVRVGIEKEMNKETLVKRCQKIGRNLMKTGWLKAPGGGVKCNYIPKGSDPEKDSVIGGYYISQKDFGQ